MSSNLPSPDPDRSSSRNVKPTELPPLATTIATEEIRRFMAYAPKVLEQAYLTMFSPWRNQGLRATLTPNDSLELSSLEQRFFEYSNAILQGIVATDRSLFLSVNAKRPAESYQSENLYATTLVPYTFYLRELFLETIKFNADHIADPLHTFRVETSSPHILTPNVEEQTPSSFNLGVQFLRGSRTRILSLLDALIGLPPAQQVHQVELNQYLLDATCLAPTERLLSYFPVSIAVNERALHFALQRAELLIEHWTNSCIQTTSASLLSSTAAPQYPPAQEKPLIKALSNILSFNENLFVKKIEIDSSDGEENIIYTLTAPNPTLARILYLSSSIISKELDQLSTALEKYSIQLGFEVTTSNRAHRIGQQDFCIALTFTVPKATTQGKIDSNPLLYKLPPPTWELVAPLSQRFYLERRNAALIGNNINSCEVTLPIKSGNHTTYIRIPINCIINAESLKETRILMMLLYPLLNSLHDAKVITLLPPRNSHPHALPQLLHSGQFDIQIIYDESDREFLKLCQGIPPLFQQGSRISEQHSASADERVLTISGECFIDSSQQLTSRTPPSLAILKRILESGVKCCGHCALPSDHDLTSCYLLFLSQLSEVVVGKKSGTLMLKGYGHCYVPKETFLAQFDNSQGTVSTYSITAKPNTRLLLTCRDTHQLDISIMTDRVISALRSCNQQTLLNLEMLAQHLESKCIILPPEIIGKISSLAPHSTGDIELFLSTIAAELSSLLYDPSVIVQISKDYQIVSVRGLTTPKRLIGQKIHRIRSKQP